MVIPTIPQLHESLLGPHVASTDIDNGSFGASLVCDIHDKPGTLSSAHPGIKFDEPIQNLRVVAKDTASGKVVWNASYFLGGSKELSKTATAVGGAQPSWTKICTPNGALESYKIDINGSGANSGDFNSNIFFTSNNAHTVRLPKVMFPTRPSLIQRPPNQPPIVPISPLDFNPLQYL